jgi:DNA-binding NarL/FixJ family response regulator
MQAGSHGFDEVSARDILGTISASLKPRERAVLDCLADGLRSTEIARRLKLSPPTVTKDRRRIARMAIKFGVATLIGSGYRNPYF